MFKVRGSDFAEGRWPNGAGISWSIASAPPGAVLPHADWQFSTAQIERSVPFSLLPGLDRVTTLLDGPGFNLSLADGREIVIDRIHVPTWFPGDVVTECRVTSGPSKVLNLLFARSLWRAEAAVTGGDRAALPVGVDVALVFALKGAATLRLGLQALDLAEGDAGIIERPGSERGCFAADEPAGRLLTAFLFRSNEK